MPIESGRKVAIWSIEDKGTYAVASLSTTKKDKSGSYSTDWSNKFCWLQDKAYENTKGLVISEGEHVDARIGWGYDRTASNGNTYKQSPFSVTNKYDKEKKTMYTNYSIFDLEVSNGSKGKPEETTDDTVSTETNVTQEETESHPASNGFVGLDFLNTEGFNNELPFK